MPNNYLNFDMRTREAFKQYILRKLGHPLITIELSNEQIDDAITDAMEVFTKYIKQEEKYLILNLNDYLEDEDYILLPNNVQSVFTLDDSGNNRVDNFNNLFTTGNVMMNMGMLDVAGIVGSGTNGNLSSMFLAHQSLETLRTMNGKGYQYEYVARTQRLTLTPNPKKINKNDIMTHHVVLGCYVISDDTINYSEQYVKKMALGLAMQTLGTVRSKFSGLSLLGGGEVDSSIGEKGEALYDKALEELKAENVTFSFFVG